MTDDRPIDRTGFVQCHDSDGYLCFEEIVAHALERHGASLFAYRWMTNHVHLAIQIADAPLGSVMGIVASRHAHAKQKPLPTAGHLFERRYRARLVDVDRYLLALVRYIHLNPVRVHMVTDPRDYRWSSHRVYLGVSPMTARIAYVHSMNEVPDDAEQQQITPTARSGRALRVECDRSVVMSQASCRRGDGPPWRWHARRSPVSHCWKGRRTFRTSLVS